MLRVWAVVCTSRTRSTRPAICWVSCSGTTSCSRAPTTPARTRAGGRGRRRGQVPGASAAHRACMALWCGNNEVQMVHGLPGPRAGRLGMEPSSRPAATHGGRPDGAVPYWPGSPWVRRLRKGLWPPTGSWTATATRGGLARHGLRRGRRRLRVDRRGTALPAVRPRPGQVHQRVRHPRSAGAVDAGALDLTSLGVHSRTFDLHNKDNLKDKGDAILEIITVC